MTFSEIQSYILERLSIASSDTVMVTRVKAQANAEWFRLSARHKLNLTFAGLDFVAGSPRVELPGDWTSVEQVSSGSVRWERVSRTELFDAQAVAAGSAGDSATPIIYALEPPMHLRIVPSPTVASTGGTAATLYYNARPIGMVRDSDRPFTIPDEFHDMLCESVVARIAASEEALDLAQQARSYVAELMPEFRAQLSGRGGAMSTQVSVPGLF